MSKKRPIAFSPPDIREEDIAGVVDTLRSGWITTGPKTLKFEKELAAFCHADNGVAFSSATSAMEMTLRLLGVGPGDEVITSVYTYTASASIIHHVGAKVVLVDSIKDQVGIDASQVAAAITERTKVIIPVDVGGIMCDYDALFEAVEQKKHLFQPKGPIQEAFRRVIILADAAHSLGATYHGRRSGEVADFSAFSFHAVKNLTTAEGGAVLWKNVPGMADDEIYKQFRLLALHGQSRDAMAKTMPGSWEYDIVEPYYKCNMTDIQASLGLTQLQRYDEILARRKELITRYDEGLKGLSVTPLKHYSKASQSSGHLYMLRLDGKSEEFRNRLIQDLAEDEISTNVHYKPLPLHSAYRNMGFDIKDFPNAHALYQNEITLPLHTLLSNEDVDHVCQRLRFHLQDERKITPARV